MTEAPTLTFWDHFGELRQRLVKAVIAIIIGAVVAFLFNEQILDLLKRPLCQRLPEGDPCALIILRPTEAFSVVMRLSLFGGLVLASPVVIYQLWRFVSPALTQRERRYAVPLTVVMTVLFLSGVVLGYWSLTRGLDFLLGFGGDNLEDFLRAEDYLSFTMRFIFVFGVAFLFPVFLFAAAALGMTGSARLRRGRRWAITIIVVVGAVITPSGDPLTLLLLSAPLYVLFELTILAIRYILRK